MCLSSALWARVDRIVYANDRFQAATIGFDDALIYEQVAKAPDQRIIPCEHRPNDHALSVFQDWAGKADRVPY